MAHSHDLTISELIETLAEKTLQAPSEAEFEKLRHAYAHIIEVLGSASLTRRTPSLTAPTM